MKKRQGHCGNSQIAPLLLFTQSVDKSDQHREAHWGSWYQLPSRHIHGLVKHYPVTFGWCTGWLIEFWSGKSYRPHFDMVHIRWETDRFCSVWPDSLTDHIKRNLDHPNSVCTAARQPRTLKHWHILHSATEGVLTQTHQSKNLILCNNLCSGTSYVPLSTTIPNIGGTLEKKISEPFLRVFRVACMCLCA